jgi:hypothetical protein
MSTIPTKRILVAGLAVLTLAGCATSPRLGPPAPIVSTGRHAPRPPPPPAPPPETSNVEVYAYRAPREALPEEAQPIGPGPETTGNMGALRVERPPSAAAPPPGASQPPGAAQPPQPLAYAPPPQRPSLSPAAAALAEQAEQQRQTRDYVGAAATLERALRIEPQQAYLWNRLARVRLEQGYQAQAGNLAARSNSLAKDEPGVKRDNWSIIAAARRAAGDTAGASQAEQMARGG